VGIFDDMNRLKKQSDDLAAASGRPTTFTGKLGQLPDDLRNAADQAEWARTQQQQAAEGSGDDLVGGTPGVAVLHGHRATAGMVGFQPVSVLDLEIRLPGAEPYRLAATVVVPYQHLVLMTAGRELPVRVDPADRTRIAVDWP
jgi:hypothetical protein